MNKFIFMAMACGIGGGVLILAFGLSEWFLLLAIAIPMLYEQFSK